MIHPYHRIYRQRVGRFGKTPRSNGYLVSSWAAFERDALQSHVDRASGRLLDVGCGTGFMTDGLQDRLSVFACDASVEHLSLCPNSGRYMRVAGDAFGLPFSNESFDVVVCANVVQWYAQDTGERMLAELVRVARVGGQVMILVRNAGSLIRNGLYPLYKAVTAVHSSLGPPLYGYDRPDISKLMFNLGCEERVARYLFPPLRLQLGPAGRSLGTTLLLAYEKAESVA